MEIILGIATVIGGIAAISYFFDKIKSENEIENEAPKIEEKETLLIKEKRLPSDILDHIDLGDSLDFIKETLSNPKIINDSIYSAFDDEEIKTTVWFYEFSNADLCIESDDGKSVSVITLQVLDEEESFNLPILDNIKGLAMGKIMDASGFESNQDDFVYFSSMRDNFVLIECYFGRAGMYRNYVFGCYDCADLDHHDLRDNKFISMDGKVFDERSIDINFISISNDEKRGHPIGY